MSEITLRLTEEQATFLKNAIDAYVYATTDVMPYEDVQHRRITIIDEIYGQMPDELFLTINCLATYKQLISKLVASSQ